MSAERISTGLEWVDPTKPTKFTDRAMKKSLVLMLGLLGLCFLAVAGCEQKKVQPEEFFFYAIDRTEIRGDLYIPHLRERIPPLVILLHMYSHSRKDYDRFVPLLTSQGYAVLSLDLRGHGASTKRGGESLDYLYPEKVAFRLLPLDIEFALNALKPYLGRIDIDRVGIVGANIGANAGLIAAGGNPKIKALVLVSPGLSYHELKTEQSAGRLMDTAVLLICSRGDNYSLSSCQRLSFVMPTLKKETRLVEGSDQGNKLLAKMPELNKYIASWIKKNLPARRPDQIE